MTHPLERKVQERESELAQINAQLATLAAARDLLAAEIAAYKDALQYLSPSQPRSKRVSSAKRRGISGMWLHLLEAASGESQREFVVDDVVSAGELLGYELTRANVRTQAANFVNQGLLDRVRPGVFRLTQVGIDEIRANKSANENGEAEASPDADQGSGPDQYSQPSLSGV